ncbi:hypothetical protein QV01_06555 [Gallibacterium genomosp. 3]|uniref:Glycosyl transferase n=1 Tax=Gallibacterium genomosp. 3 TaxID=505345 RepID=A0A1A7NS48_9PAST|nr:glycosyltransferase [Gallibacterium genomosp. 3]OBW91824.1 hypothetical protein QV01_06555 [Gallibacterium genomosp. 3]
MVSDVARLHAIYYEGGIYLDTDMELIKSLEPLLDYQAFGYIEAKRLLAISLFGAQPLHAWIGKVLSWYKTTPFRDCYGTIANTRIISRMTELHYHLHLAKVAEDGNNILQLNDNMCFLPRDYFWPKRDEQGQYIIGENTISIHHSTGLW